MRVWAHAAPPRNFFKLGMIMQKPHQTSGASYHDFNKSIFELFELS